MQIVHADDVPYKKPRSNHREGEIEFRRILQGEPGGVHNFEFLFAKTGGRFTGPRHRHNFDQVRLVLNGTMGDRKGLELQPGQIGYYPEGTYYQIDSTDSEIVLLQFAAASGWGYMSYDQIYAGAAELNKLGEFRDGVFFRRRDANMAPGTKKNQDGYEAIWEHTYGRKIEYPKPRYDAPVHMNPENFPWVPDATAPGTARRLLGSFTERRIEIAQMKLDAGAVCTDTAATAPRFLFVLDGEGRAENRPARRHSTIKLETGESVRIETATGMQLLVLVMPTFSAEEIAFFEARNRRPEVAAA